MGTLGSQRQGNIKAELEDSPCRQDGEEAVQPDIYSRCFGLEWSNENSSSRYRVLHHFIQAETLSNQGKAAQEGIQSRLGRWNDRRLRSRTRDDNAMKKGRDCPCRIS